MSDSRKGKDPKDESPLDSTCTRRGFIQTVGGLLLSSSAVGAGLIEPGSVFAAPSKRVINIARMDGNVPGGERLYQRECGTCHAADGYGKAGEQIPALTGQHSEYLRRQIAGFRKGERLHADTPEDQSVFELISEGEIKDILSWLAVQDDS